MAPSFLCIRVCCVWATVAATLATANPVRTTAAESTRPNILFLLTDDHATQAIGAYGSDINETPNLDRLAKEGMLFRNSFCANSICGPSRASILTGKHSHANGVLRNGDRLDTKQVTFPQLLQAAGYQTALIGKWHLDVAPVGFDHWEILPGQGHYYNPDFLRMDGEQQRQEGYCTDIITDKSLQWLTRQRDPTKPFLLMCQHKAPHRNWAPAARHLSLLKDIRVPEPDSLLDDYRGRTSLLAANEMSIRHHMNWRYDMKFQGENLFPAHFIDEHPDIEYERMTDVQRQAWDDHYEPENQEFVTRVRRGELSNDQIVRWKYQRYVKDYLRCVAAVDEGVGRLLEFLDERGFAENTLVIYASDQGFYLGEHGWYDKRWMFEESLKMPLIVRWPGKISQNRQSEALVQNIDYAPTILDAAGVAIPREMQGRSMLPLLKSTPMHSGWRDAVYYAYYENAAVHNVPVHDGVRTNRYKLMRFPRTQEWQLFDLVTDPQEMTSFHVDPAYATVLSGMTKRYHDLRRYYRVNSAVIPQTRADEPWWQERFAATKELARQGNIDLVFIGDSITQSWEDVGADVWRECYANRKALNLGFSGDRTEHIIWRLQNGSLDGISPKVAVVMVGTNNTGHSMQPPEEIHAGVQRIVKLIRDQTPKTKVLLFGIFPRGASPMDETRLNNVAINQYLAGLDDGQLVCYRDIGHVFLEPDGSLDPAIMPDALHLSSSGYRRWADALEPILGDWGL